MPKIYFYLIRHAQSKANICDKNLIGGQSLPVELTSLGENQAKVLGNYLKHFDIQFTKAFCSTAIRTQQTAKICFQEMGCQLSLTITDQIVEQSAGGWTGQSKDIYNRPDVRKALDTDNWTHIPGDDVPGESQKQVAERMHNWIKTLLLESQNFDEEQHVAVFTHGLAIKFLLAELLDLERSTAYTDKANPIENASITLLCYEKGKLNLPLEKRNFCPYKEMPLLSAQKKNTESLPTNSSFQTNTSSFFPDSRLKATEEVVPQQNAGNILS